MSAIDETLAARGEHYGDFKKTFAVIQQIKLALQAGEGWDHMPLERREALEMIAVKMGRLVSGDSGHADSRHDIAGYAQLVEESVTPVVENFDRRNPKHILRLRQVMMGLLDGYDEDGKPVESPVVFKVTGKGQLNSQPVNMVSQEGGSKGFVFNLFVPD